MMTFVGQAFASVNVSCQAMGTQIDAAMIDVAVTDHSQHMSSKTPSVDKPLAISECCPDCDCSLGGCTTAVLSAVQQTIAPNPNSLTDDYVGIAAYQIATSLFRPPISLLT